LGKQKWYTIGRPDEFTVVEARAKARDIKAKLKDGVDPSVRRSRTTSVAELCDRYLVDAERLPIRRVGTPKKNSTLVTDRGRIENHIKPLLGQFGVSAVTQQHVENFQYDVSVGKTKNDKVSGGKGAASRTVGLLGAIFSYAVKRKLRGDNPVRGVVRYADEHRERRLSDDEYMDLGRALRSATGIWPPAVPAAKFMALTGWRRGEVLGLRWNEVDLQRRTARLVEGTEIGRSVKTSRSMRPLSKVACDVLKTMEPYKDFGEGEVVFPSVGGRAMAGVFWDYWRKIARDLPSDVCPQVLRHSFGSVAGDLQWDESTIARLIGHKRHSMTSRYVHYADVLLLSAVDDVADRIAELMGERSYRSPVHEAQVVAIR
jgi:site-specific recombinase XerD